MCVCAYVCTTVVYPERKQRQRQQRDVQNVNGVGAGVGFDVDFNVCAGSATTNVTSTKTKVQQDETNDLNANRRMAGREKQAREAMSAHNVGGVKLEWAEIKEEEEAAVNWTTAYKADVY
ncbi:unnamed protein product [Ceratitis capitata]|uniref:(Mediterranean fruit fly) hypothetical protein n=1 Tax=Ceratitis capitata TaxID=7213 RepID=A0A811VF03_CERCA|nr:unnamed protein product [Ceratitis capitata]